MCRWTPHDFGNFICCLNCQVDEGCGTGGQLAAGHSWTYAAHPSLSQNLEQPLFGTCFTRCSLPYFCRGIPCTWDWLPPRDQWSSCLHVGLRDSFRALKIAGKKSDEKKTSLYDMDRQEGKKDPTCPKGTTAGESKSRWSMVVSWGIWSTLAQFHNYFFRLIDTPNWFNFYNEVKIAQFKKRSMGRKIIPAREDKGSLLVYEPEKIGEMYWGPSPQPSGPFGIQASQIVGGGSAETRGRTASGTSTLYLLDGGPRSDHVTFDRSIWFMRYVSMCIIFRLLDIFRQEN